MKLRPLYWPAVIGWALGAAFSAATLAGLATWSWHGIAIAAAAPIFVTAALLIAIRLSPEDD